MKKICVIVIGGSGCDIVKTLEENYKLDDNIKIIGSDSAICGMRDCKNKLPLERVYPIYCKVKGILEENDDTTGDIMCCIGCNGNPILGEVSANYKYNEIKNELNGVDKLILTTVFGGGTGTGAIKEFIKIAKELKIDTTCIISMPIFSSKEMMQSVLEVKKQITSMGIEVKEYEYSDIDPEFKIYSIKEYFEKFDRGISKEIVENYLV